MEYKTITNSSQIIEIGYDFNENFFIVVYKNNSKYKYLDVDPSLWVSAQSCDSVGKFVNEHIKSHKFTKLH